MAIPYEYVNFILEGQKIRTTATKLLVERTRGVYQFFFEPGDDFWDAAENKMTAIFWPAYGQKIQIPVLDFQCVIPVEALQAPFVRVGVCFHDGSRVFPTAWSSRLAVEQGTTMIKEE